jgi:hypothetical protein
MSTVWVIEYVYRWIAAGEESVDILGVFSTKEAAISALPDHLVWENSGDYTYAVVERPAPREEYILYLTSFELDRLIFLPKNV